MVVTTEIKPAPVLQKFISCYSLREFNTGGQVMIKPLHAVHELYMTFFLRDPTCLMSRGPNSPATPVSNNLCSLFTESQGYCSWNGNYAFLSVQFTANGIAAILGIEQKILINTIVSNDDILGRDNGLLTERLQHCSSVNEMGAVLDSYLVRKLLSRKQSSYAPVIAGMTHEILRNKGNLSLDRLIAQSNMSIRTFERNFVSQVGITAKLYARIARFFNAVEFKMLHPATTWTDISYEHGYYDQAHFIKDCKEFSDYAPERLFIETPPPVENFVSRAAM